MSKAEISAFVCVSAVFLLACEVFLLGYEYVVCEFLLLNMNKILRSVNLYIDL